ncbi:hypothetical protein Q7P36_009766 [Cladosporium allicinum]
MDKTGAAHARATEITAVTITFLITAWMAVLARTWVRAVMIRNYGWDDAVMLLAVLTYTLYASFNLELVSMAFGNSKLSSESWHYKETVASYILVSFSLHAATMVILKISLGIFYLRIVVSRWQKVTVYATVGIATIYGCFYFFAVLFSCGVPAKFLVNALQDKCWGNPEGRFATNLTAGTINAVSDFILATLPITLIRKACMPLPAKLSACLILLLGCVGSAVSVVRLAYVKGMSYNMDFFQVGVNITLWSIIEAGLCITAASLATLRPLFRCCIDTTRRSMTADSEWGGDKVHHRTSYIQHAHQLSDESSPQDRSLIRPTSASESEDWPLRDPASALPRLSEISNAPPSAPGSPGIIRKASVVRGKVQWVFSK